MWLGTRRDYAPYPPHGLHQDCAQRGGPDDPGRSTFGSHRRAARIQALRRSRSHLFLRTYRSYPKLTHGSTRAATFGAVPVTCSVTT